MIRTKSTEDQGIALTVIQTDGGTQSCATLNQHVVDDYAEAIQAGATFPPIVVFYDGKKHWLADGFHRFHAYQKADRDPIALTETYSIRPYAMRVPNRTALGTSFMTEKAEYHLVSLPLLSI